MVISASFFKIMTNVWLKEPNCGKYYQIIDWRASVNIAYKSSALVKHFLVGTFPAEKQSMNLNKIHFTMDTGSGGEKWEYLHGSEISSVLTSMPCWTRRKTQKS